MFPDLSVTELEELPAQNRILTEETAQDYYVDLLRQYVEEQKVEDAFLACLAWEEKRGEDVPKEACEGAVMKRGVIVRQLLLPGCLKDARNIVRYLYETYQNKIYVSLMSQYTPLEHVRDYPELAHRVSRRTYDRYVDAAIALGITQAFIQEPGVAKESFIPDFSNAEGV